MRSGNRKAILIKFTPAYEALHPYVRRPDLEGDYHLPFAAEYHASTSELVQMLEKGHHGVRLDQEAWDRLVTWIDLDVPCHGTWSEILPVPFNGVQRRRELLKLYADYDDTNEEILSARSTAVHFSSRRTTGRRPAATKQYPAPAGPSTFRKLASANAPPASPLSAPSME